MVHVGWWRLTWIENSEKKCPKNSLSQSFLSFFSKFLSNVQQCSLFHEHFASFQSFFIAKYCYYVIKLNLRRRSKKTLLNFILDDSVVFATVPAPLQNFLGEHWTVKYCLASLFFSVSEGSSGMFSLLVSSSLESR